MADNIHAKMLESLTRLTEFAGTLDPAKLNAPPDLLTAALQTLNTEGRERAGNRQYLEGRLAHRRARPRHRCRRAFVESRRIARPARSPRRVRRNNRRRQIIRPKTSGQTLVAETRRRSGNARH